MATAESLSGRARFREILVGAAEEACAGQASTGAMPAGHNGPYHHAETPVRNTAHWAISFTRAWELTGEPSHRDAAERAVGYLVDTFEAGGRTVLPCRHRRGKDVTNGVMGQAWAVEALAETGERLGLEHAMQTARELYLNHPYRPREGAWLRLHADGSPNGFDWTFNHQLWFCAAGALLVRAGCDEPVDAVNDFLARLPGRLRLYRSGLIRHASSGFLASGIRGRLEAAARGLYFASRTRAMREKSLGYHCFNTYALALIERCMPGHGMLHAGPIARAFDYVCSDAFWHEVGRSRYGFPYNPPGLEAAFSIDVAFPQRQNLVDRWLQRQLDETWDSVQGALVRQAADPETARARLYEVSRLV